MDNPFESILIRLARIEEALARIASAMSAPADDDKPLTIQEAAEYISLKKSTVYGLVHRRQIPFHKRGKRVYFIKSELREWIQDRAAYRGTVSLIARKSRRVKIL